MIPTREQAWDLLCEYNEGEFHRLHARIVGDVMRYFAVELGYDDEADFWQTVGILHDLDFEQYPDQHCTKEAEILREKGTNRAKFFRGQVDKYTWVDFGDSYLPSELNAAYLWAQLLHADEINENRLTSWHRYREAFLPLAEAGKIELQHIPAECTHNAHMFYLKCKNLEERTEFIRFLKENDILAVFHYIPLHSAPAGEKFGRFDGEDVYTTAESERLVRLPMYYGLTEDDQNKVIAKVLEFYEK